METQASDKASAERATDGPLAGINILDLTRVLSGPFCTMLLGDMGARVIKIEQPGRGDDTRAWGPPFVSGESAYFLSINRNKESVTLDFKHPEGRRILEALLHRADVFVENFRPGTLSRIRLDYDSLAPRHPALVYCSISGFGQSGPKRGRPGYDAVVQAEGGLMSITGAADGPPYRLGVAIADLVAGLLATQGILLALLARGRTGRGQSVDISMLDGVAALLTYQASIYLTTGEVPCRMGNRHPTIVPYETFGASDGNFVLAIGNDEQFRRFCRVADLEALATDPRFTTNADRVKNYDQLWPELTAELSRRSRTEWMDALTAAGVPCGAVRNVREVLTDPQLEARRMIETVEHATAGTLRLLGIPIKLSETPGRVATAPPTLGQHTNQVLLGDLGLDSEHIEVLRGARVL